MVYTSSKTRSLFRKFSELNHDKIKFQGPLIVKMYGTLNKINLRNENRYILCNFIDQNSDLMNIEEDIYMTNNNKTLNQLFLLAYNKAKDSDLLNALYEEYTCSIEAISQKIEFL
jgi:hypothetical protein